MFSLRLGFYALSLIAALTLPVDAQVFSAAPPNARAVEPGDQLTIQVYGDQALSQVARVAANGAIAYPLIGSVVVAGKTPEAISALIVQKLEQYVKHPSVTVAVTQTGEEGVLVLGNVKTPGKYLIRSGGDLIDALAAANGLGPTNGDLPVARITYVDGSVRDIPLQKLLHDGDAAMNVVLQNDSVIYVVSPNPITVNVVGAIDRPGSVQIAEGDRLSMAIARAGTSSNAASDLNHVVITRTDGAGATTKQVVNMYNALKGGDLRSDPILANRDVIYVPMGKRPGSGGGFDPMALIMRLIAL